MLDEDARYSNSSAVVLFVHILVSPLRNVLGGWSLSSATAHADVCSRVRAFALETRVCAVTCSESGLSGSGIVTFIRGTRQPQDLKHTRPRHRCLSDIEVVKGVVTKKHICCSI
jgi:hypothetical protein